MPSIKTKISKYSLCLHLWLLYWSRKLSACKKRGRKDEVDAFQAPDLASAPVAVFNFAGLPPELRMLILDMVVVMDGWRRPLSYPNIVLALEPVAHLHAEAMRAHFWRAVFIYEPSVLDHFELNNEASESMLYGIVWYVEPSFSSSPR